MGSRKLSGGLFLVYLGILAWIILLKTRTSFAFLPYRRSINLIPFGGMAMRHGLPNYNEVLYNGLVFIPLGIFLGLLSRKKFSLWLIAPVFLLSLFFEVSQYVFAIGSSDITDVLANTLGGLAGLGIFFLLQKLFKENVSRVINASALVLATGFGLLILSLRFL